MRYEERESSLPTEPVLSASTCAKTIESYHGHVNLNGIRSCH